MYFHQMFEELPNKMLNSTTTPVGTAQVRDYEHMLELINAILTTAPTFNKTGSRRISHQRHPRLADGNVWRICGFLK